MHSFIFFVLPFGAYSSSGVTCEAQAEDVDSLIQASARIRDKQVPTTADQYGREYDDTYTHRINTQVQQVTAVVDTDDGPTMGYLQHATYHQHRVCVGATDAAVADIEDYHVPEFTLDEPICFNNLKIGYLAGYVSCRNALTGRSHYGCDQDSIGLVLAKKVEDAYQVVFPKAVRDPATGEDAESDANREWNAANIEGYSFMGHGHADWYQLTGYTGNENVLQLTINPDGDGGVFLPRGTYRLWYHEDLADNSEHDNSGVACYHLDFELCQGSHLSSFHHLSNPLES